MSKSSRNQPVAFPADAPVIDAESTVDASEAPETSESASETISNAPEAVSEAPATPTFTFIPQKIESMPSQHEVAQHIAALLAEEDAEMATLDPPPSEKVDLEAELDAISGSTLVPLPDGSLRASIIVPAEMVPVLKEWANGADEGFEPYLQRMIEMALNAVVLGASVAG